MLVKNLPMSKKIGIMPVRILLDAITAWKGLLAGDSGYFIAILKAHFSFANWLFFHKKDSPSLTGRNENLYGYLQKSIVWQFFVKKKTSGVSAGFNVSIRF